MGSVFSTSYRSFGHGYRMHIGRIGRMARKLGAQKSRYSKEGKHIDIEFVSYNIEVSTTALCMHLHYSPQEVSDA
jgi:hypothetical protein